MQQVLIVKKEELMKNINGFLVLRNMQKDFFVFHILCNKSWL